MSDDVRSVPVLSSSRPAVPEKSAVPPAVPAGDPPVSPTADEQTDDKVCRRPWLELSGEIKSRLQAAEKALKPLLVSASAVPSPVLVQSADDIDDMIDDVPDDLQSEWRKWATFVLNSRALGMSVKISDSFKEKLGGKFSSENKRAWSKLLPHCRQDREFLTPAELTDDVQEQLSALRLIFSVCGGEILSAMLPVPLLCEEGRYRMAFSGPELQALIDDNEIRFFGRFDIRLKSIKKNGAFVKKAVWFN